MWVEFHKNHTRRRKMRAAQMALAALLVFGIPAWAQHGNPHGGPPGQMKDHGNPHGGPPGQGPEKYHGNPHRYAEYGYRDHPGHSDMPHVDGDRWIGHDTGPYDPHYHMGHPWRHGHFDGGFGRGHMWRLMGGGPGRFWFSGYSFSVAPYDTPYCNRWNWDSDDVAIYPDQDHVGWYLAFNSRLGTYVHVMYMGR
jgi:hypothetical protein